MSFFLKLKNNFQRRSLTRPELAMMFDLPPPEQWVAIDCEMTGLNTKKNHILSVAAIHINSNRIDTGNGLYMVCRPPQMPSADTIVIHGLRPRDVEDGMSYDDMLSLLLPFIGNRPIVGFCPQLDMAFLNLIAKAYMGTSIPNQIIDIRDLYNRQSSHRSAGVTHHSHHLDSIIKEFAIPELGSHDAYNDAVMTAMVFLHLR